MELADLLRLGMEHQASDMQLRAGRAPVLRRGGALEHLPAPQLAAAALEHLLRQAMPVPVRRALDREGSTDFVFATDTARARVHVFRHAAGIGAALRLIPACAPTLAELGLPARLPGITDARQGLVLVTGASGSGKSTTLAALVDHFNRTRASHILTLEDPVEFLHDSRQALITQRDMRAGAHCLRAALRQDPDIIMLGEMRDTETIALALQAAETGHLVLSTLHTRTAADAVARILAVFPAAAQEAVRVQLSLSLRAVMGQALLPAREGRHCVLAYEMLVATPAIRHLIRENHLAQIESQQQTGRRHGMHTLSQYLDTLVESGRVAHDEAARLVADWN